MAHYDADGAGAIHTIRNLVIDARCSEGLHRVDFDEKGFVILDMESGRATIGAVFTPALGSTSRVCEDFARLLRGGIHLWLHLVLEGAVGRVS